MQTRLEFVHSVLAAAALPSAPGLVLPAPGIAAVETQAEAIFKRAKDAWRERTDAPYLAYAMRERYTWRDRPHETWWHAWYRLADRRVALQRIVIAQEEQDRLRGSPIAIHMRFHQRNGPTSFNLDTNPNADAFAVEDPLIEPIGSFGMLRSQNARLVESDAPPVIATLPPDASPALRSPSPSPSGTPAASAIDAPSQPLHELVHVEAVARDYRITNLGIETLAGGDAYHLELRPLRDPYRYRLRDLWVATADARTLRLTTQGLFAGPPYDTALWTVAYTELGGRSYLQEITTDATLRFGPQHGVDDFAFDFVGYTFPDTVPESVFTKLL